MTHQDMDRQRDAAFRYDAFISYSHADAKAAARAERQTAKRRRISAFDVIIAVLWMSVVLAFSFAGLRENAPQEIKVLMTPGLLLIVYGLVLLGQRIWEKGRQPQ